MSSSRSVRRVLALTATGGLVAAVGWLPAAPANAAVQAGLLAVGEAGTSGSCTLTSGDDNPETATPVFSHGQKTRSVDLDATFTNTGDSSDVVQMSGHYTGTVKVARKGANLGSASLTGSGHVKVSSDLGSSTACDPTAEVLSVFQSQFTESQKGWLYVERTTPAKAGITELITQNTDTGAAVAFEIYQGGQSHALSRGFVTPGNFSGVMVVGLTAGDTGVLLKRAPTSSLSMVFHKVGSAVAGTKGAGKRYVEFPGAVSCSKHTATLGWKASAGQVDSATFLVNGKQKASDGTPRGGDRIVLRHLSSTDDLKITAKLRLKGGGRATATRSYVPCKAL
jgi:hypothetical protein